MAPTHSPNRTKYSFCAVSLCVHGLLGPHLPPHPQGTRYKGKISHLPRQRLDKNGKLWYTRRARRVTSLNPVPLLSSNIVHACPRRRSRPQAAGYASGPFGGPDFFILEKSNVPPFPSYKKTIPQDTRTVKSDSPGSFSLRPNLISHGIDHGDRLTGMVQQPLHPL